MSRRFARSLRLLRDGGAAFAALGTPKNGGTRLSCLSGHVNKPGVYELPLGFHVMQMIEEVGGGMRGGKKLKAVIPGGSSCPVLKADEVRRRDDGLRFHGAAEERCSGRAAWWSWTKIPAW